MPTLREARFPCGCLTRASVPHGAGRATEECLKDASLREAAVRVLAAVLLAVARTAQQKITSEVPDEPI